MIPQPLYKIPVKQLSDLLSSRALEKALQDAASSRGLVLDTLDADRFTAVTRWGRLAQVLEGIEAATRAGMRVKINTVALKGFNEDELFPLLDWCADQGHDLTFIEVMPMGEMGDELRLDQYWALSDLRARLAERLTLTPLAERTGGPARYVRVEETGQKIGFITPLTHNFCESCNRVRLTCTGELFMCLGQEDRADLRAALRSGGDDAVLRDAARLVTAQAGEGEVGTPRHRLRVRCAGLLVGAVISAWLGQVAGLNGDETPPFAWALVYAPALTLPLALRRRYPEAVLVTVALAFFVVGLFQGIVRQSIMAALASSLPMPLMSRSPWAEFTTTPSPV